MSKTFDEYFRVFSNYTDKELIAMAQPERSDKMERSELHALVQVMARAFKEGDTVSALKDAEWEVEHLREEINRLEDLVVEMEEEQETAYWETKADDSRRAAMNDSPD